MDEISAAIMSRMTPAYQPELFSNDVSHSLSFATVMIDRSMQVILKFLKVLRRINPNNAIRCADQQPMTAIQRTNGKA